MRQLDRSAPRAKKEWTAEEKALMEDKWGTVSIKPIARILGRSVNSVKIMASRLGLGAVLESGDYITLNQLFVAVTGSKGGSGYAMTSWVKNRHLPVHTKRVVNCKFRVVYLDEFWKWAEKNRSFIDFSKMEPLALGKEPDWVADQRKKDFRAFAIQRKDPWTAEDDSRLKMLMSQNKYGYAELSEMLHRSCGAIQRRILDLGIKERPIRAGNDSRWTDEDFEILADGIRNGESYTMIGNRIGKSEKAVRGKVYFDYLTEKADKVREMMGDGNWGDGAPVPTVKQAVCLSRTRTATKAALEDLVSVLYRRTLQLKSNDYDNYFQREVCQNWNELDSCCTVGCTDCDYCTEFKRIDPQVCVRCGKTFYERQTNRMCRQCRSDRRKQAYKKWRCLHG